MALSRAGFRGGCAEQTNDRRFVVRISGVSMTMGLWFVVATHESRQDTIVQCAQSDYQLLCGPPTGWSQQLAPFMYALTLPNVTHAQGPINTPLFKISSSNLAVRRFWQSVMLLLQSINQSINQSISQSVFYVAYK